MGLLLTCQPVVMAITASISGPLSDRIGSRAPATAGLLIVSVALFLLSRLQGSTPTAQIAAVLLLTGLGIGLFPRPTAAPSWGPSRPSEGAWPTASWDGTHAGDGAGDRVAGRLHHHPRRAGSPDKEAILGAAGAGLWWVAGSPCWGL